jgi:TorA maturation chaperone TorD
MIAQSPSRDTIAAMANAWIDETEQARANLYRLLAITMARPPDEGVLTVLAGLDGDAGEIGAALRATAGVAGNLTPEMARREYDALFLGMTRGEVVPYASFYLTGFLYERPLARIREDMAELGVALADGRSDPEDHVATIMDVMASLIDGAATAPQPLARQRDFFRRHIEPWAGRFFADLEQAESARLYRPLGAIGRLLVALEREAFALESA